MEDCFGSYVIHNFRYLETQYHFSIVKKNSHNFVFQKEGIQIFIGYDPSTLELASEIEFHSNDGRHCFLEFSRFLQFYANQTFSMPMPTNENLSRFVELLATQYQNNMELIFSIRPEQVPEMIASKKASFLEGQRNCAIKHFNEVADELWKQKRYAEFLQLMKTREDQMNELNRKRMEFASKKS